MSLAELFESGEMKRQRGHFRNLVLLARADGFTTEEEMQMLVRFGRGLGLTAEQVDEIRNNPEQYPIEPPSSKNERHDRLVSLVEMIMADGEIDSAEMDSFHRSALGLGFQEEKIPKLFNRCMEAIRQGLDRETIISELDD